MERSRKQLNVDRLSSLPDSILCHILSFLPTKFPAATCILARRWRFLWADVPIIDLDFQFDGDGNEEGPRISDIISRILLWHNLKALNTFRLKHTISNAKDNLTQYQLETWIAAVISRGKVRNIKLEFSDLIKIPDCLLTYKSLVDLRLYRCEISVSLPASISFASLEKLHLCRVKYSSDATFQHLISGCSILEELVIKCNGNEIVYGKIISPTLKLLKIDLNARGRTVEIITPALRYLLVKGYSRKCVSAEALLSLTEANISLVRAERVIYSHSVLNA